MKTVIPHLHIGQRVLANVEAVYGNNEMLINFSGDLLRTLNKTGKHIFPGEQIELEVRAIHPLQFLVVAPKKKKRNLDLSV